MKTCGECASFRKGDAMVMYLSVCKNADSPYYSHLMDSKDTCPKFVKRAGPTDGKR